MKKTSILFLLIGVVLSCSPKKKNKYNLDFEKYFPNESIAFNWKSHGDFLVKMDSTTVRSGKYSINISSEKNDSTKFHSVYYEIPAHYIGKSISLEGYVKTEKVENGYCGLLFWLKSKDSVLSFENMSDRKISGTKDWTKYSITTSLPEKAQKIYLGGYLTGTGNVWFDDFSVSVDGKNIESMSERVIPEVVFKADLDKEFEEGSGISIPKLNDFELKNLVLLGKVWGFLKYHHPKICEGNYNWDYELFRFLPTYLNTTNLKERNLTLDKWITGLGEIPSCTTCETSSQNAKLRPSYGWINEYDLGSKLINKLKFIYNNRCQGGQYYYETVNSYSQFKNEDRYLFKDMGDDDGLRLLSLYRYWNIIEYYFPYKYLTEKDWSNVLMEYIPEFISAKSRLSYELAVIKIIGEIQDTHAQLNLSGTVLDKKRGEFYAPYALKYIEGKWVVDGYYNSRLVDSVKVRKGDIVTHIGEKPIEEIVDSIHPYYPASNEAAKLNHISKDLLRSNSKELEVEILRENLHLKNKVTLYEKDSLDFKWYKDKGHGSYQILKGNIGYISLNKVTKVDVDSIKKIFKNTKGAIVDIRNYPNGGAAHLWPYFCKPDTPFAKFTKSNIDIPGEFNFTGSRKTRQNTGDYYDKPIAVLVNENSVSLSEFTAMAFRTNPNTTIIGSTTAGADGNITFISLPGGLQTQISGIGVYYPDGSETQRVGIVPDVVVKPTIKGIQQGKDEVLDRAIQIIEEQ